MYDYLVVGAGLFGSVFAHEARKNGKRVLVVDKRKTIGGNCFTKNILGINVHAYGAHIFHTSKKEIWDYINQFAEFNNYINSPIANYNGQMYNLPFNMNTFEQMWGVKTAQDAQKIIASQVKESRIKEPKNLEEQAISMVGLDIYEKLIKGYTQKQWGKQCKDLPSFIIKRLPLRFTYDNNYFNDNYQGIPIGGYTQIFEKLLKGIEVKTGVDFLKERKELFKIANKIIYTGAIDEYFGYCYGELEYRSLEFVTKILKQQDYQNNAVVNYTDEETPFTRIIEHKYFEIDNFDNSSQNYTVITHEYPKTWIKGDEPYYPVNNEKNDSLYKQYAFLAKQNPNIIFGGRLGNYKYYDMDKTIEEALSVAKQEFALSLQYCG